MKAKELRGLSAAELKEKIDGLKKELFGLRFKKASGELKNILTIRSARRNIAKALTILKEKGPKA